MKIDKSWILLVAVVAGAAGGAAYALASHRRGHKAAGKLQHKHDLRSWENEGGNLAPAPAGVVTAA